VSAVVEVCRRAAAAAPAIAACPTETKNAALLAMAEAIEKEVEQILQANGEDLARAAGEDIPSALRDRLTLTEARISGMSSSLRAIAQQPDPVGEVVEASRRPNGLSVQLVRAPLGVVAVIYEARPNVTTDVAGLCLKAGNACILRGSSLASASNGAITECLRRTARAGGLPNDCIQLLADTSRAAALELMRARGLVDLLVPRGGRALIESIEEHARVPYIIDGDGNCTVYVDRAADPEMALAIVFNAKTQRPGVCNAAESLLVHRDIASTWLPLCLDALAKAGVEVRGDGRVLELWPSAIAASEADWATEYLDLIIAVRVVDSLEAAIEHVNRWGTSNAEAIVTQDQEAARRFVAEVDSGSVFVNASTRFSDGGELGLGAEIGISTQKLHARGPMGARALTAAKYVVWGSGQIRN
jgi:glutamate-5-semialdehyde dehydrogenase